MIESSGLTRWIVEFRAHRSYASVSLGLGLLFGLLIKRLDQLSLHRASPLNQMTAFATRHSVLGAFVMLAFFFWLLYSYKSSRQYLELLLFSFFGGVLSMNLIYSIFQAIVADQVPM